MSKSEPQKSHHRQKTKNGLKSTKQNNVAKSTNTEKTQLQLFRDEAALPKFTANSIVKILFASALLTPDWKAVIQTLYEIPSLSEKMDTKTINSYNSGGMSPEYWEEISSYLSESDLKQENSGVLEKRDEHLNEFSQCIAQTLGKDSKLDSLTLAKAYFITYSSDYKDLLKGVLPKAPYHTRRAFQSFLKQHPNPKVSSLCTIFEYLK
ncbi:MAG TPA: hypothetical protein ENI23_02135 [bacterium]|nr:hypothetical protein [bacterium]